MPFLYLTAVSVLLVGNVSQETVFVPHLTQERRVFFKPQFTSLADDGAMRNTQHLGHLLRLRVGEVTAKDRKHVARPIDALARSVMLHGPTLLGIVENTVRLLPVTGIFRILLLASALFADAVPCAVLQLPVVAKPQVASAMGADFLSLVRHYRLFSFVTIFSPKVHPSRPLECIY